MMEEENRSKCGDLALLYKVWKEFSNSDAKKPCINEENITIFEGNKEIENDLNENDLIENPEGNETKENDEADYPTNSDITTQEIRITDQLLDFNNLPKGSETIETDIGAQLFSDEEVLNMPVMLDIDCEVANCPIEKDAPYVVTTANLASDNHVSEKCDEEDIRNILVWPKTPEMKGTREVKRMPYVLTGTQWRKMKKDQEEEKENKKKEKEDRKQKREQKTVLSQVNKTKIKTIGKQVREKV